MKIIVLDITSRLSDQYVPLLCEKLSVYAPCNSKVILMSNSLNYKVNNVSFVRLLKLIPDKFSVSRSLCKRILRLLEVILNYIYLLFYCLNSKPNILHLQWLVLVDYCVWEKYILKIIKKVAPNIKIFLTVHNVMPHDLPQEKHLSYQKRFKIVASEIDGFIVHLESTKQEISELYGLDLDSIHVAYHGLFEPATPASDNPKSSDQITVVMYGLQNYYKGTDLLVEAVKNLPLNYQSKIYVHIMGKTDPTIYNKFVEDIGKLPIRWDNNYVSNEYLSNSINNSDLIILPYRKISQSGVLLLALAYNKPILTSDLPSFRETMAGYDKEWFFENENIGSLTQKLIDFVDGKIDVERMKSTICELRRKYSWDETAKATLKAYNL